MKNNPLLLQLEKSPQAMKSQQSQKKKKKILENQDLNCSQHIGRSNNEQVEKEMWPESETQGMRNMVR